MGTGVVSLCFWPLRRISHSSDDSGWVILWIKSNWTSLNVIDVSEYLMAGLITLILVITISFRLVFVETIRLAKSSIL